MQTRTLRRFFPHGSASLVNQDGSRLTVSSRGVEVILHTSENDNKPCCAEVTSEQHHAEIGLSFAGKTLTDYDGVFFLPREVGKMLTDVGYFVSDDCFA